MRKRKRLIIVSVVVFFGVCVAISQMWSQRPYRFLAGAKITDYDVGAQTVSIQLESDEPMADLILLADAELLPGGWKKTLYPGQRICSYTLRTPGARSGPNVDLSVGPGRTYVQVTRSATLSDRITAWLYKLKQR